MSHDSTARGRELGAMLEKYRNKKDWTVEQLAGRLGWSCHKLVYAENGERPLSELDAAVLLTECGATRPERDVVLELLDGHGPAGCWARPHGDLLPDEVPSVLFQYQRATAITCYRPDAIPAVLKCGAFLGAEMRERFGAGEMSIRHEVAQSPYADIPRSLDEPPVCYMNERTLRAITVNEEDRLFQFEHMARLIRDVSAVIRVVPVEREHVVPCGGFSVVRFAEAGPVVCVPTASATLLLEGEHVAVYERFAAELDAVALPTGASADLIVGLAGGLDAVLRLPPELVLELVREAME